MTLALWYVWLQCLGGLALILTWKIGRALPDRGYCAAKTLGALAVGLIAWWGFALGLVRNSAGGVALVVFALAGAAALVLVGSGGQVAREIVEWARARWRLIVAVEVLQLVAFLGWCLVRANDPAADHTEEPMDLMLLVAVSSSDSFPPADPWLSGYPISYYYLGYWLLGTLGHLVGTAPEITYNLGQATWYALLLVGCFGLAYNLAARALPGRREGDGGPMDKGADADARLERATRRLDLGATGSGLLAAVFVGASANIALPLDWGRRVLAAAGSAAGEAAASVQALFGGDAGGGGAAAALWSENWWWWRSSRVVHDLTPVSGERVEVITEFPFFSYLLGDNHPHLLAMPIVVATLTLAFAVFANARTASSDRRLDARQAPGIVPGGGAAGAAIIAVAGAIVAINTWDVPAVFSILVLAVAGAGAATATARPLRRAIASGSTTAALLVLGSVLFYLPYHLTASSQVEGILPNLFHPTALREALVMFATLVPGVFLLLLVGWRRGVASLRRAMLWWVVLIGGAVAWLAACTALASFGAWSQWLDGMVPAASREGWVGIVISRWSTGWVTFAVVAALLAVALEALRARVASIGVEDDAGLAFALLLSVAGLALILAPELVYLHDSFATRMNTVFKFWYQAWLLLASGAAVGITSAWKLRGRSRAASALALLAIVPGLFYPVAALWTKTGGFGAETRTLDALAWVKGSRPDEIEAMQWLRNATGSEDVVVQRSGASYRAEQNLPSIVTGRPTLLGWGGHEYQWRGSSFSSFAAGREEAIMALYRAPSTKDLERTLRSWNVDYVYLGPEERAHYAITADHESVLAAVCDLVFENAQVRIYRRRG